MTSGGPLWHARATSGGGRDRDRRRRHDGRRALHWSVSQPIPPACGSGRHSSSAAWCRCSASTPTPNSAPATRAAAAPPNSSSDASATVSSRAAQHLPIPRLDHRDGAVRDGVLRLRPAPCSTRRQRLGRQSDRRRPRPFPDGANFIGAKAVGRAELVVVGIELVIIVGFVVAAALRATPSNFSGTPVATACSAC